MNLSIILTPHIYHGNRYIKVETVGYFRWFSGPYEWSAENEFFDFVDVEELYQQGLPRSFVTSKEHILKYQEQ